jgi:tRNA uridine 5-carbamoylmethylation protein Kti12
MISKLGQVQLDYSGLKQINRRRRREINRICRMQRREMKKHMRMIRECT